MLFLECSLLRIGIAAGRMILAWTACERKRRVTIPCGARERRVDLNALPVEHNSEITMDVNEAVLGDSCGDFSAEQLLCASAIERVDAMHDLRLGLREALGEPPREEQVLG